MLLTPAVMMDHRQEPAVRREAGSPVVAAEALDAGEFLAGSGVEHLHPVEHRDRDALPVRGQATAPEPVHRVIFERLLAEELASRGLPDAHRFVRTETGERPV